jgi:aryl-alcohol dehydrogenase-like predicted oxidoreductase
LLQLHCPPTELYSRPEVFGMLDDFVKAGKVRYYGVSVEKIDEALNSLKYPNVQSVQIIFNCASASVLPRFSFRSQTRSR